MVYLLPLLGGFGLGGGDSYGGGRGGTEPGAGRTRHGGGRRGRGWRSLKPLGSCVKTTQAKRSFTTPMRQSLVRDVR